MIAAVLDTNVLASGFAGWSDPDSTPGDLIRRWRDGQYRLVVSNHILGELERTFTDRYFTRRLGPDGIRLAFAALYADATIVPITIRVFGVATQPKDDLVIATALSGRVPNLVTGDRALRERGGYRDTRCFTPREFAELLKDDASNPTDD